MARRKKTKRSLEDELDNAVLEERGDPGRDPELDGDEEIVVDLTEPPQVETTDDGVRLSQVGGEIVVDFDGGGAFSGADRQALEEDFTANLAEVLEEDQLKAIAEDIVEWVETDERSRKPWWEVCKRGLELLGLTEMPADAAELFPGSSKATYPLIAQAVVQFNARSVAEILPPGGPVKATVVGNKTPELQQQADRVADHMNYQLTVEDKGYYPDADQMLMNLPLTGSMFKKVFRNSILDMNQSRTVRPEDFIVPYTATSLEDAPRYTHRIPTQRNDMRKMQASGFYRDVDLVEPTQESPDRDDELTEAIDEADNRVPEVDDKSYRHTVYECHCDYDLPKFEDPDGIALPYIITIDYDTRTVLSIRRNWRPDDPLKRKRVRFTHHKFIPGPGFYGLGYIHLIGGLADATTGSVRALLDSAAFANMQGGFKSKDAKMAGDVVITPGVWKDVDMTAEELAKSFYTPPFKEPSVAMFQLLGLLVEAGQSFTSTTENMVGDAKNNGPVGTTVALIEQGSKVYSGIHKRLHFAAGIEFQLLAELNFEHLPDEGYPYDVRGAPREIARADYDGRVDVIPVSDPNIFSSTQRIAIAQALLDLSDRAPDLYDRVEVHRRMLDALRVPDPEGVMAKTAQTEPMDPVSENMAILMGRPVRAYAEQDHESHLKVLLDFMQHPGFGGNPQVQELAGPALMAHAAEHLAFLYQRRAAEAAGIPLRPVNLRPEGDEPFTPPAPPSVDNGIANLVAQATEAFKQSAGLPVEEAQDPAMAEAQAKIERENAAHVAEEKRKADAFVNEQRRQDAKTQAEITRMHEKQQAQLDAEALSGFQRRGMEAEDHQIDMARGAEAHAMERAAAPAAEGGGSEGGGESQALVALIEQQGQQTQEMLRQMAESMQMSLAVMAEAVKQFNAPKKVVRDEAGRVVGVEPAEGDMDG